MAEVSALTAVSEQAALEHILRHHAGATGWVTLARRENGQWTQSSYRVSQIENVLPGWLNGDSYFSQQTFSRPGRKIENIRQLRAIYADVDCHLIGYDIDWTVGSIMSTLVDEGKLPEPNLIVHSGRGLHLVWWLAPAPAKAIALWQAVERYFVKQLKTWGADPAATDAARVLRLAGTINTKSDSVVTVQHRHELRYELRDLQRDYLPDLIRKPKSGQRISKQGQIDRRLHNERTLYWARLQDLLTLCKLREWHMTGHREVVCFLYRYWKCHFLADKQQAIEDTLDLNAQFIDPLTEAEVRRATRSAETAFESRDKEYRYTNKRLIELLNITPEEEQKLSTIIGAIERRERNRKQAEMSRRRKGAIPRDKYLAEADQHRIEAIRLRGDGLSYRAIATAMNTSLSQVQRMLKSEQGVPRSVTLY